MTSNSNLKFYDLPICSSSRGVRWVDLCAQRAAQRLVQCVFPQAIQQTQAIHFLQDAT